MVKEEKKKIKEKLFNLGEKIKEDNCLKCLTKVEREIYVIDIPTRWSGRK